MESKSFLRFLNSATSAKEKSITISGTSDHGGNKIEEIKPYLIKGCSAMTRNVMVVVDATREANRAVLWVLTHGLLKHERLILLHVVQLLPSVSKESESPFFSKRYRKPIPIDFNLLNSLKQLCMQRRPEVEVEVMIVGGKEKGPTILHIAKKLSVSLLVLGQPKPPLLFKLRALCSNGKLAGKSKDSSAAVAVTEYCIQNSECMTVAVRNKSRSVGGYMISTKRLKNFWLLA